MKLVLANQPLSSQPIRHKIETSHDLAHVSAREFSRAFQRLRVSRTYHQFLVVLRVFDWFMTVTSFVSTLLPKSLQNRPTTLFTV